MNHQTGEHRSPRVVMVVDQLLQRVPGGVGAYTSSAMSAMGEVLGVNPKVTLESYSSKGLEAHLGYSFAMVPHSESRLAQPFAQRIWDRGYELPHGQVDLLYSFSMGGPKPKGTRRVRSLAYNVHDVIFATHPELFPPHGRRWHQRTFEFIAHHANKIVTVSKASSEAMVALGVGPERIAVIGPGSDHLAAPDTLGASALLANHGVRGPFILSVSTIEPRKNLRSLIEAYKALLGEARDPLELVVVGPTGWGDGLVSTKGVHLVGFVEPGVLSALYARAEVFVYVPIVEGYGLPVVEANSQCTPVVASDIPSASEATYVVDHRDPNAIAQGVLKVLYDDALRSSLVTAGLLRTTELTWERCAQLHLELFDEMTGGASR